MYILIINFVILILFSTDWNHGVERDTADCRSVACCHITTKSNVLERCFCVDCARADSSTIRGKREFLHSDSTCQIFLEFLTNIHEKSKNQSIDNLLFTELLFWHSIDWEIIDFFVVLSVVNERHDERTSGANETEKRSSKTGMILKFYCNLFIKKFFIWI